MNSQFLLAAAHSGAGKTTVMLGLLRALQRMGLRVQPFKCGPDYIDPIHHRTAAGTNSINLDRFMMSDAHIRQLYNQYGSAADVGITEGVMGLFDGAKKREGSSADIARLLGLPVILILDANAMAYSAKSSAEKPTKNRPREKRERRWRQFVGSGRRRASLRKARA